jgi:hypothetical protein
VNNQVVSGHHAASLVERRMLRQQYLRMAPTISVAAGRQRVIRGSSLWILRDFSSRLSCRMPPDHCPLGLNN